MTKILDYFFSLQRFLCISLKEDNTNTLPLHSHTNTRSALNVPFLTPAWIAIKLIHQTVPDLEMKTGASHFHVDLQNSPILKWRCCVCVWETDLNILSCRNQRIFSSSLWCECICEMLWARPGAAWLLLAYSLLTLHCASCSHNSLRSLDPVKTN